MSDKSSPANPLETEKKKEEKMDSVGIKKEEKAIEEEIGYIRLIIQTELPHLLMPTGA